jgi:hypothetical protein
MIAQKMNLHIDHWQWGVGASIAESWVMARWKTLSPELLPVQAISDFLNPLDLNRNTMNDGYRLKLLQKMGANSVQDVLETPEDVLISSCGFWITDFIHDFFTESQNFRDQYLEQTTAASLFQEKKTFHLDDWIPDEYFQVA